MCIFASDMNIKGKSFEPYISAEQIIIAVKALSKRINKDYRDAEPLFVIVLNGSFMFASDLLKEISISNELTFMKVASYEGDKSTGHVNEIIGLDENVSGRDIIVVEDIVDTGITAKFLLEKIQALGPKSIEIVSLLTKPTMLQVDINVKYAGIEIPPKFVVGYGMDYNGFGRSLNEIYKEK